MNFSDEQEMLRDTVRTFLQAKAPLTVVRHLMETDAGFDPGFWQEIAAQGWQAMAIPEAYGGAGFGFVEQGILLEEMGRALTPVPYLSSVVLGADLVLRLGDEAQRQDLVPGIASGDRRVAVAHLEPGGRRGPDGVTLEAVPDGDDLVLTGTKSYVLDGHTADTLLVVARRLGTVGVDGIVVVVVPGDAPGVTRRRLETLDMTRKQAEVVLAGVRVPASAALGGGDAWTALGETLTRAVAALAYEQVGGAVRVLEMSVEYAKVRVQFGRPIGSFQAIKHMCADMLVLAESARSAAHHAGAAIAAGDETEIPIAVPLAASYCSEAYFRIAADSIQLHGGIGFTWEHDAHLYLKRAKTDELLFGTPAEHRARLGDALGL